MCVVVDDWLGIRQREGPVEEQGAVKMKRDQGVFLVGP